MQSRLIEPTVELEASHETFVNEFRSCGEPFVPWIVGKTYVTFIDYIVMLQRARKGVGIPQGFVAHSTYWLIDDAREIVAVSNLRHELSDRLLKHGGHIGYGVRPSARRRGYATEVLKQTLIEARRIGIRKARLTCDKGNSASAKTILRNGGELDEEEFMPEHGHVVSRYWITL